jgi:hypothetical protein
MRALMALVVASLVGMVVAAHDAAAASSQPKVPGLSISADLGPVSVDANVSTAGTDASVDVATPAASVDATVAASSTAAPVSATLDASTPVGGAAVDATASSGGLTSTAGPVHVEAKAKSPLGSTTVKADTTKGLDASAQVENRGTNGKLAVRAGSGEVAATTRVSTPIANAKTAVVHPATPWHAAATPGPKRVSQHKDPVEAARVKPALTRDAATKALQSPPVAVSAASTPLPDISNIVAGSPRAGTEQRFGAAPAAAVAPSSPEQGPAPAPVTGSPSGAAGSGLSTAGFFAILSALLSLAVPLVGRWLRSTSGLALQPAFASLPERPG